MFVSFELIIVLKQQKWFFCGGTGEAVASMHQLPLTCLLPLLSNVEDLRESNNEISKYIDTRYIKL